MKARTPQQIADEWLTLRAQDGDERALVALVNRWQPALRRHCLCLTGNAEAAADALQETWIAVARGLGQLEDPARFRSWAYRIATRKSIDWVRRRKRENTLMAPFEESVTEGESAEPRENEAIARMQAALRSLPVETRLILSLYYQRELSVGEIAKSLDLPKGTVKSRLFHARRELKTRMERITHEV